MLTYVTYVLPYVGRLMKSDHGRSGGASGRSSGFALTLLVISRVKHFYVETVPDATHSVRGPGTVS